jgi:hypothetical protein
MEIAASGFSPTKGARLLAPAQFFAPVKHFGLKSAALFPYRAQKPSVTGKNTPRKPMTLISVS